MNRACGAAGRGSGRVWIARRVSGGSRSRRRSRAAAAATFDRDVREHGAESRRSRALRNRMRRLRGAASFPQTANPALAGGASQTRPLPRPAPASHSSLAPPAASAVRLLGMSARPSLLSKRVILASAIVVAACAGPRRGGDVETVEFWGMGREGEVVAELVPEFERRNPEIRVKVQQIPWTAAHEKLLTANVGGSLPDLAQLGNTWIPEFHVVRALEDLTPYASRSATVRRGEFFDGIWETSLIDDRLYGVPWYVDTRVLFYRTDLLREAGITEPPRNWSDWVHACAALRSASPSPQFRPMLLPTNEWPQPVVLAVNAGATFVNDDATAHFNEPGFIEAFDFYLDFFRRGDAPVVAGSQIANLHQQFGEGEFAMLITGPWNVGEMRRRLPADKQSSWTTAPIPARDGAPYPGLSIAGGSSLAIFATSKRKDAAWKFIEFLAEPAQQVRFYELSGNLPARRAAWDAPSLQNDREMKAFRAQLDHTVALPRIPEWERIATAIFEQGELAARGQFDAAEAARRLDTRVDALLDKRRWVLAR